MLETFSLFHFIRPYWLFALIPLVVIITGLMLKSSRRNQWTSSIDKHLLKHLLVGQNTIQPNSVFPLIFLAISLLLAVLALAGPTWEKRPLPVFETEMSKVLLLDLSLSMQATDIKPSRLIRAKHKINDLLSRTNEGQVALIVYAGDAFVISPLTTDANTILTMVPSLSPSLMPVLGSEPQRAFQLAEELLSNAGVFSGQIIWITDGIDDRDYNQVAEQLKASRHQISILAVGTREGAPIPLPDGQGFLKDAKGNIVLPSLKIAPLEQLASLSNGNVTQLSADDQDIERLLSSLEEPQDFIASDDDLQMDTWIELGPWLLLPLLLITAFSFRKGVVVVLALVLIPLYPSPASAAEQQVSSLQKHWINLWQTSDQQAAKAFNKEQHSTAAELFQQADWKSAALYKSGEYNAAAELLASNQFDDANYNRGNALAQAGRLEEAIIAYDSALEQTPNMEDAIFNKKLVEDLLKQQQEQEQQQQDGEKQQQQDGEKQQQQDDQQQQDGEQEEGDEEQESDQQSQDQQQKDQQEKEQESEQQKSELEQMNEAEREQVLEQWLRMIKDDPGGLLRRKMYMEYQKRQQQGKKLQDKGEKVW
ncbi:MAG: hypothetical protein COA74_14655 [Gammaproteobacteria bacterium]|nr:MAG: hypothetical protein COA74_14655 [Gammaproteobacteria bacterium]